MGNIGDTMASGTVPPVGTAGTAYATQVNNFLTEVKGRLEAKVPLSSLQPGELNLLNNPVSNAQYVGLYEQTAPPTLPIGSLQSFGDDLYWVSPSGAAKITTGSALNAAGIGGITGDYGGINPAQFRFVDVDETFYAYDNFGLGNWARVGGRSFDVYGAVAGTNRVRITWAGSTSYTLTLPAALPASSKLLQVTSAGVMSASNSVDEVTVSADFNHTAEFTKTVPLVISPACTAFSGIVDNPRAVISNAAPFEFYSQPFDLRDGDRVKNVRVRFSGNDGSSLNVYVYHYRFDTGLTSTLTSTTSATGHVAVVPGAGKNTIEVHDTMLDQMYLYVAGSSATPVTILGVDITWDHV